MTFGGIFGQPFGGAFIQGPVIPPAPPIPQGGQGLTINLDAGVAASGNGSQPRGALFDLLITNAVLRWEVSP